MGTRLQVTTAVAAGARWLERAGGALQPPCPGRPWPPATEMAYTPTKARVACGVRFCRSSGKSVRSCQRGMLTPVHMWASGDTRDRLLVPVSALQSPLR